MSILKTDRKVLSQNKYRRAQANKALVRYELQVDQAAKERFEEVVKAVALEYDTPWDERRRLAKARSHVFLEMTRNVVHHFSDLQTQIEHLKQEIKALTPAFFTDTQQSTSLPEAIQALPDDPQQLKAILTKTFNEAQLAKLTAQKYKSSSEQYRKLHEVSTSYNDELKKKLKAAGLVVE